MPLYTKTQLKSIARSGAVNETRNFSNASKAKPTAFDIFLCHSFLDKEEVEGLYLDLSREGYSVYVDWIIDPELDRTNVTGETARLVRQRLRASKSLLLAFSTNIGFSKWVPWELGYVDGHMQNCALIPVASSESETYNRAEYLKLYPMLERQLSSYSSNKSFFIAESKREYVELNSWLGGGKPTYRAMSL